MKKKIALLLACVLAISTFTACGGGGQTADAVPTLKWYIPGTTPADCELVEAELNKIIEPKVGAKIDFVYLDSGAYDEKTNMMMASGDSFDLAFSGWINTYTRGVSLEGFMKLNDYLDKAPALKEAIPDYAWDAVKVNGEDIYAIPNLQIYAMWQALYVTKEYADKYGLDASKVEKMDDLVPFMEQVSQNEKDVYTYKPGIYPWAYYDSSAVIPSLPLIRVRNEDENCKAYLVYETDEYYEGVKAIRDYYERGFIRKDVASAKGDSTSSKETVITAGAYKPGALEDIARSDRGECVAIPFGEPCVNAEMSTQTLTAIGANCKYPEKAIKIMELVNTDKEVYHLIVHGIKGKHYEETEDGHIRALDTEGYNLHNVGWYYGNQFNSRVLEGKALDVWEQMEDLNNNAIKSPLLGFSFDSANVVNELANISAIYKEFIALYDGSVETDSTLAAFKKKMSDAGVDRVLAEVQRQIDEFLAKK